MNGRQSRTARFVQTLVFYDEPQLVLLKSDNDTDVIAVAVNKDGMDYPFFACEVRPKTFGRYLAGKADLHYLFEDAIRDKYYFLDLRDADDEIIPLIPAAAEEAKDPLYRPLPGAFSRSHTFLYGIRPRAGTAKVFKIDGNWSASDFARFHGKISNLYAMIVVLNNMDTPQAEDEKGYIKESIQKRFWAGGGSYLGFYDDLFDHVQSLKPLEVDRIQYASPGEIALSGDSDAFSDIDRIIEQFESNHRALHDMYNGLHRILAREKLLRPQGKTRFSNPQISRSTRRETTEFATAMKIEKIDEIYEACDRNSAIFCKVILSIYRRANEIYMFHAEGRVQESRIIERSPKA
jgi:hypothetical protein